MTDIRQISTFERVQAYPHPLLSVERERERDTHTQEGEESLREAKHAARPKRTSEESASAREPQAAVISRIPRQGAGRREANKVPPPNAFDSPVTKAQGEREVDPINPLQR
jgi:hypothetical protein